MASVKTVSTKTCVLNQHANVTLSIGITGRMMTVFDTEHSRACDAMIQENYFVQTCLPPKMHLKSSSDDGTAPYHVVFALDKSGSMWGTKLDQTKVIFKFTQSFY